MGRMAGWGIPPPAAATLVGRVYPPKLQIPGAAALVSRGVPTPSYCCVGGYTPPAPKSVVLLRWWVGVSAGAVDRELFLLCFLLCFMIIAVLRSGRCLKSFLEGVASFSPSMSPWGATGTPLMTIFIDFGHTVCVQTVRFQPEKNDLLHMDA